MSESADPSAPLIQACPGCGGFLDVSDQEPFAQVHCPSCGTLLRVRTQFNSYTLQSILGTGGMGTVFKALDFNLQRHVALKVLRREFSSSAEDIGKLEREARITAMVNHPNVVKIFSFGNDHNQFYLAMELVEKGSLDDLLELQGQIAELQVLEIGYQVAAGLQAANQMGLIHRDVKPGNILFADAHTTKIVDFGLAIVMEEEAAQRGEVWGTPYYVAPEKLDHRPEDFRSDIYSLGGTMFHALAGRPPYEAQTASLVALKHLKSQSVSLQAFAPDTTSETAYVVNKMIHKDPEERYQSYDELLEHLNYAKERVSSMAATRSRTRQRVVVESQETQTRMGGIVLALLGVVLLGGLGFWFFRDSILPKKAPAGVGAPPTLSAEDVAGMNQSQLEALYSDSRQLIIDGDFASAQTALMGILKNKKIGEPARTWVRLQYGLATYLGGDTETGDSFFREIGEELSNQEVADTIEDRAVLNAILEAVAKCTEPGPVSGDYASLLNPDGPEALTTFLFAARNWSKSAYEEAGPFLFISKASRVQGALAWIRDYQPLVEKYSKDWKLYRSVMVRAKAARTPEEQTTVAAAAEDAARNVQTTGGLSEFLQEFAKRTRAESEKARTEKAQAAADSRREVENRTIALLKKVQPAYATAIAHLEIEKAGTLLEPLRSDASLATTGQAVNKLRILEWLKQFKASLITDLTTGNYAGVVTNRTGATLGTSIAAANDQGIEVKTAYGSTRVAWSELPPKVLVQIAEQLATKTDPASGSKMLWLAGVYAHESGDEAQGKALLLRSSQAEESLKEGLSAFFEVEQPKQQ